MGPMPAGCKRPSGSLVPVKALPAALQLLLLAASMLMVVFQAADALGTYGTQKG